MNKAGEPLIRKRGVVETRVEGKVCALFKGKNLSLVLVNHNYVLESLCGKGIWFLKSSHKSGFFGTISILPNLEKLCIHKHNIFMCNL